MFQYILLDGRHLIAYLLSMLFESEYKLYFQSFLNLNYSAYFSTVIAMEALYLWQGSQFCCANIQQEQQPLPDMVESASRFSKLSDFVQQCPLHALCQPIWLRALYRGQRQGYAHLTHRVVRRDKLFSVVGVVSFHLFLTVTLNPCKVIQKIFLNFRSRFQRLHLTKFIWVHYHSEKVLISPRFFCWNSPHTSAWIVNSSDHFTNFSVLVLLVSLVY